MASAEDRKKKWEEATNARGGDLPKQAAIDESVDACADR